MALSRSEIILIGPPCVGKTEVGKCVAKHLAIPSVSLDDHTDRYYKEEGFEKLCFMNIEHHQGYPAALAHLEPALVGAVGRILDEFERCVFDFGAAHTVFTKQNLTVDITKKLKPFVNVVLLMPCADRMKSTEILRQRNEDQRSRNWKYPDMDLLKYWVQDDQNWNLATHTIFTDGLSVQDVCVKVIDKCKAINRTGTLSAQTQIQN